MRNALKKIIPRRYINLIRSFRSKVGTFALFSFPKSKLFSDFYYLFVREFSNEHQAVLKGRKAYHDNLKNIGKSCALLRRNTHRLEKGLIMRPRRNVFAEKFIQETVDCYNNAVKSAQLDLNEEKWVTDVLDEYFKIAEDTVIISRARKAYKAARKNQSEYIDITTNFPNPEGSYKPYSHENLPDVSISFDELKQLFIRRRSVRWYLNKHVPIKLVQQAVNIASFAPSACNRQPYRFLFCNDKDKAVAIAKCAGGTSGFAENLPAIIVVVGDLSAYPYERDRHLIFIDGSLASMQLMLALETLEISSCSINWPEVDTNEKKIRKLIKLKDYERIVMLMAVGYADKNGGIPYSQKKQGAMLLEDVSI